MPEQDVILSRLVIDIDSGYDYDRYLQQAGFDVANDRLPRAIHRREIGGRPVFTGRFGCFETPVAVRETAVLLGGLLRAGTRERRADGRRATVSAA